MGSCKENIGSEKKPRECGKPDIGGTGLCSKHGGKVTVEKVVYGYCLVPEGGLLAVNETFAERAGQHLYQKAIQNFLTKGPGGASRAYSVNGVMLAHDTCGAGTGNHASVFFRWAGNTMHVYALGYHPGDDMKKYELMWYDGSDLKWTRPG